MAGFLSVLGPLATVAGLTEPLEKAGAIGLQNVQNANQLEANQKGFASMVNSLDPNEYGWAQEWLKQAGPGGSHDVAAALTGKFGDIFQKQAMSGQMSNFLAEHPNATPDEILMEVGQTKGDWGPYTGLVEAREKARLTAASKPEPLTTDQMADSLIQTANTPGLTPEYSGFLRDVGLNQRNNPAAVRNAYEGAKSAVPQALKPQDLKQKDIPSVYDPASGLFLKRREIQDPRTLMPIRTETTGIDFNAAQKAQLAQASEAVYFIPKGIDEATKLQKRFDQQGWTGINADRGRQWLNAQWQAYTAARRVAGLNPLSPESWQFQSYKGVDDGANRYFTIMGQLTQQMGQPMGIFRAMRIYQDISTHIPIPSDLPSSNLHKLQMAKDRFGYELERVENAEQSLTDPAFAWIGASLRGGGGGAAGGGGGGSKRMTDKDADAAIDSLIK